VISSIKLKNIYKGYGPGKFCLKIGELEFNNKHVQVIVGPNGSGKSTLLSLLAFLDRPDQGNILVDGSFTSASGNGRNGLRRKIGFLRQSPYLFNTNVFENVALGLVIRKYPRGQIISKVNEILTTLKIDHLARRFVRDLSCGEYQKAAIAQVLVLDPEVILMDEPAANIDAQSTFSIEETIKSMQKRINPLIIMTTHSLTQAYRLSPGIISIRGGEVVDG